MYRTPCRADVPSIGVPIASGTAYGGDARAPLQCPNDDWDRLVSRREIGVID